MENDYNTQYTMPQTPMMQVPAVLSLGQWLITLIVMMIPCVGFVMTIVWAFGNGDQGRKNFCRASLILMVASIVLAIIFSGSLMAIFSSIPDRY